MKDNEELLRKQSLGSVLAELEEVIRLMPPRETLRHQETGVLAWLGRASAVVEEWGNMMPLKNTAAIVDWRAAVQNLHLIGVRSQVDPKMVILRVLYQAQSSLRMATVGPVNVAVGSGQPFEYFDEVRKLIEQAATDIFVVDPYLNADFVSRYLPNVKNGVTVRLLILDDPKTEKHGLGLKAAAELFFKQYSVAIEIRAARGLHDRWLFIDKQRAFFSGSSFKDGGVKSATILTQNVDTFSAVNAHYESVWGASK